MLSILERSVPAPCAPSPREILAHTLQGLGELRHPARARSESEGEVRDIFLIFSCPGVSHFGVFSFWAEIRGCPRGEKMPEGSG